MPEKERNFFQPSSPLDLKMEKLVKNKYNETRPLITIRSDLPKNIFNFIKQLKKLNKGSKWINEAIIEKYRRDARIESRQRYEENIRKPKRRKLKQEKENNKYF